MAAKTKQMKLQHDQREQEAIQEIDMLKKKQPLAFKNTLVGEKRTRDHRGVAELRERIDKGYSLLWGEVGAYWRQRSCWARSLSALRRKTCGALRRSTIVSNSLWYILIQV